jgi:hypothetical protein
MQKDTLLTGPIVVDHAEHSVAQTFAKPAGLKNCMYPTMLPGDRM